MIAVEAIALVSTTSKFSLSYGLRFENFTGLFDATGESSCCCKLFRRPIFHGDSNGAVAYEKGRYPFKKKTACHAIFELVVLGYRTSFLERRHLVPKFRHVTSHLQPEPRRSEGSFCSSTCGCTWQFMHGCRFCGEYSHLSGRGIRYLTDVALPEGRRNSRSF